MKTKGSGPAIHCICCRKEYPDSDAFNRHAPACAAKHPHMDPDKTGAVDVPIAGTIDSKTGRITFAEGWAKAVQSQLKNPPRLFKGGRR